MKVVLANPPCRVPIDSELEYYFVRAGSRWPFSTVKKKDKKPEYVPFPFYLAYSASLLKREGFEVGVIDAIALNMTDSEFLMEAQKRKPDIVLFETSTPTWDNDKEMVNKIKEHLDCKVILAGAHVSVFPEQCLREAGNVDFILMREYELTLLKLLRLMSADKNLDQLKGITFRKNGKVIRNDYAELIDPLDELPFPDRDLFPIDSRPDISIYWDGFCQFRPAVQMHASRGCPFRCNFCLWNQAIYNNGKYRMFSPSRVVDEMEEIINKYNPKEIYFDDDSFTINKNHVLSICREIIRRGIRIQWSCMGDAIATDREMLEAMAKAGCIGTKFGVETASSKLLPDLGKPVKLERIREHARTCSDLGIKTHATFTFGLLGENRDTVKETIDFATNLDTDSAQFSINTPFPGTEYYDILNKEGKVAANKWIDFDGSRKSIIGIKGLSSEEVERLCDSVSKKWLKTKILKPSWVFRQLKYTSRKGIFSGIRLFSEKAKRGLNILSKEHS